MDNFYLLSLYKIYKSKYKDKLLKLCLDSLDELTDNRLLRQMKEYQIFISQLQMILKNKIDLTFLQSYQISIHDIYNHYQELYTKNLSTYYFYNNLTCFYPNIKLMRANKQIINHFDGTIIPLGTEYLYYRPLIDNIEINESFVLANTIKTTHDYEYILPTNISELECFNEKLKHSYVNPDYNDIDFYELSANLKTDELRLIKLRKHYK